MDATFPHRRRVKKYNVEGHAHFLTFSCYQRMPLLTNNTWRAWLAEAVRAACDKHSVALWAYVFMPEHVHLLLKPRRTVYDIATLEQAMKLSLSRRVRNALVREKSPLLQQLLVDDAGTPGYRFWQRGGGHDLNVWTMRKAIEKAEYCHRNPVLRRLVRSPEQWRWSSVRWLELGKRDGEPLRVDEWDEGLLPEECGSGLQTETAQTAGTRR
jgi:putative transposase